MKKLLTILILLLLALPAMAQLSERHIITLITRADALAIYQGAVIEKSDFVIFTATTTAEQVRGREFVTFERSLFDTIDTENEDRNKLIAHLKQFIPERLNPCDEGHFRGMDCTVHDGRGIKPQQ